MTKFPEILDVIRTEKSLKSRGKYEKRFPPLKKEYQSVKRQLENPRNFQDNKQLTALHKKFYRLKKTHSLILKYEDLERQVQESETLAKGKDPELIPLAMEELKNLSQNKA